MEGEHKSKRNLTRAEKMERLKAKAEFHRKHMETAQDGIRKLKAEAENTLALAKDALNEE